MRTAARLLRGARKVRGLSQRDLADASGVAQSTIARYESGAVDPGTDALNRLLRACGLELDVAAVETDPHDLGLFATMLAVSPLERLRNVQRVTRLAERAADARREGRVRNAAYA